MIAIRFTLTLALLAGCASGNDASNQEAIAAVKTLSASMIDPALPPAELEQYLREAFGQQNIVWEMNPSCGAKSTPTGTPTRRCVEAVVQLEHGWRAILLFDADRRPFPSLMTLFVEREDGSGYTEYERLRDLAAMAAPPN